MKYNDIFILQPPSNWYQSWNIITLCNPCPNTAVSVLSFLKRFFICFKKSKNFTLCINSFKDECIKKGVDSVEAGIRRIYGFVFIFCLWSSSPVRTGHIKILIQQQYCLDKTEIIRYKKTRFILGCPTWKVGIHDIDKLPLLHHRLINSVTGARAGNFSPGGCRHQLQL